MLCLSNIVFAQVKSYKIKLLDSQEIKTSTLTGKTDSAGFILATNRVKSSLLAEGHLLANVDYITFARDTMLAEINVGKKYNWRALGTTNIPEEMLSKVGYRQGDFKDKEFSSRSFNKLISRLLSQASNSGYPFATLQLEQINVEKNNLEGVLHYEPGPIIYYDSLTLTPSDLVKPRYLENYLRIRKGTLFQIKQIERLENSMALLPYCSLQDSVYMSFENNLCNIRLHLKPVKANKIDALIGFLPNQKGSKALLITGYVNLHLQNLFHTGKELSFVWRQFQQESQKLNVTYKHPNLFMSPLGLSFSFNLLKQDTSFLSTNVNIRGYYQQNKMEVAFLSAFNSSRSLSIPSDSLTLPEITDFNLQQLGTEISYGNLYGNTNPIRGGRVSVGARLGNKKIHQSPNIVESVYDSIRLQSVQVEVNIGGEINQRVGGPFVVHLDVAVGELYNNDVLFTNDLIRLGGIKSLRGFNDLELFVSSYVLGRFEARMLFNEKSRLFLFYDQAFTRNRVNNFIDQPFGIGAGLVLDTGNGELQLVYGLGVSAQQSLSLAQSKIHIGYIARF